MARKRREKRSLISTFLILSFVLGTILGAVLSSIWVKAGPSLELEGVYERSMTIVGVDEDGHGKLATLVVELRPGSGHLGLAVPPYENDETQRAAVVARAAAGAEAGYNLDRVDIVISIENLTTETTMSGPSASASMALLMFATIRASENKTPNLVRQDAVVSASINSIGRLEPVGSTEEKYRTVREPGVYTLFVVSKDQARSLNDYPGISVEGAMDLNELAAKVLW